MPRDQVGRTYIGKYYELTDTVLGKGSFSKVYLAHHRLFGNKVALKVTDRNKIVEEYVSKNLTREASILKKLKHPNIVNFYEDFSHNQLYCLSLELVEGPDLSKFLGSQESRRISEKFAKVLFYQMVSAVYYMHKAHVLHRDLKQENILLENGRVIKIVDFGLSNVQYPHTRLRTHCGSLEYAAPELFVRASVYGAGVDLWSLGVILYSMVTGRMPFDVPKKSDGTSTPEHRDRFYRRISLGLTEENWRRMRDLTNDCRHLLENLLQPNQFKRMQIRDAFYHPWLQRDPDVKRNLPHSNRDLKQRYKYEIINLMAERLAVPVKRVQMHLAAYRFQAISAIYYIVQDVLVKEALHPPAKASDSFAFRLSQRRKSTFFNIPGDRGDASEELTTNLRHMLEAAEELQFNPPTLQKNYTCRGNLFLPDEDGDDKFNAIIANGVSRLVFPKVVHSGHNVTGIRGQLERNPGKWSSVLKSNDKFCKIEDTGSKKAAETAPRSMGEESMTRKDSSVISKSSGKESVFRKDYVVRSKRIVDEPVPRKDIAVWSKPNRNESGSRKENTVISKASGDGPVSKPIGRGGSSTFVKKPFRSYQLNRPVKPKIISGNIEEGIENGPCNEINKDQTETKLSLGKGSKSSSVVLKYQRNLQLLNERYELKSQLSSTPAKPVVQEVLHKQEWKSKGSGKCKSNSSFNDNDPKKDNEELSIKTNRPKNPGIKRDNFIKMDNSKGKFQPKSKPPSISKSADSKIPERKPTAIDRHFSTVYQPFKKTAANLNRTGNAMNAQKLPNYPNYQGDYNYGGNSRNDPAQISRYATDLKRKPKMYRSG